MQSNYSIAQNISNRMQHVPVPPLRIRLGTQTLDIEEVEDRWYSPGETYFRVRVGGGERYVLKRVEAQDTWSLEGYRSKTN